VTSISKDTMRGYLLEELLAYWIRNTGYRLLVDESQDPDELENLPHGLGVRGRGGTHQVDVLGELAWIPAFTFPLRLIVEAKARASGKSGIDDVRNAVGLITDVNQNYSRIPGASNAALQKFAYRYALFSTTGFSRPAADYALAHQLSLVDLSGPEFSGVVDAARAITELLWRPEPPTRAAGYVRDLRANIRAVLGTWPNEMPLPDLSLDRDQWQTVESEIRERAIAIDELFVGMANGPYLVILRSENPLQVIDALDHDPVQRVAINWGGREAERTQWHIEPWNGLPFHLSFTLPAAVAEWVFDPEADTRRRALAFKEQFLSTITIYRYVDRRDRLYRLEFSREEIDQAYRQ
jgi:hypothetical protein